MFFFVGEAGFKSFFLNLVDQISILLYFYLFYYIFLMIQNTKWLKEIAKNIARDAHFITWFMETPVKLDTSLKPIQKS